MEDKLEQIGAQVADLSKQVSAQIAGLSKQLEGQGGQIADLSKQLEGQGGQIADLSKRLEGQAGKITDVSQQLSETKDEIKRHSRANMEELKTEVQLVAEAYGATLEQIERELRDLNKKVDTKFADHDLVLTDHNTRITKLERR